VADLEAPRLADEDARHLGRVLRMRPGEPVVACDGRGSWRLCRVRSGPRPAPGRGRGPGEAVWLEAAGEVLSEPAPAEPVTVGFVPVKGGRPEWVVEKLTEIGVDRIVVLRSGRAVVRWEGERVGRALERLRRVSRQAAAQSRRAWLPAVEGVWDLDQLGETLAPAPLVLADPAGTAPHGGLRSLVVGPEGGWDHAERGGLDRVSLGRGVLRAETAALAGATLLCALRDGLVAAPEKPGPSGPPGDAGARPVGGT
jgi:16S rRNA (uracil1498-N3)-methyltransferase